MHRVEEEDFRRETMEMAGGTTKLARKGTEPLSFLLFAALQPEAQTPCQKSESDEKSRTAGIA